MSDLKYTASAHSTQTHFIFTRKSLVHAWPLKFFPSASCLKLKRQPWLPLLHLHLLCPVWWRMWFPMIVTTPRSSSIRPQSVFITRSVVYDRLSALVLSLILLSLSVSTVQYYYSVRIFAGQEPSGVWVGWVTPDFHMYDLNFDLSKVRTVTVTVGDDKGNIHDRWDSAHKCVMSNYWNVGYVDKYKKLQCGEACS